MKTIIKSLLIILTLASCHSGNPLQTKVEGGLIEGYADEGLTIYKGIPFPKAVATCFAMPRSGGTPGHGDACRQKPAVPTCSCTISTGKTMFPAQI